MARKHQLGKAPTEPGPIKTAEVKVQVGLYKSGYPAARIKALQMAGYNTHSQPDEVVDLADDSNPDLQSRQRLDLALAKGKILRTRVTRGMYRFKVVAANA